MPSHSIGPWLTQRIDWSLTTDLVRRLWAWWFGELNILVPPWARRCILRWRQVPVSMEMRRDSIRLEVGTHRDDQRTIVFDPALETVWPMIASAVQSARPDGTLTVRVSRELALRREIMLPIAALKSLSVVVRHQIPRLLPLSADRLVYTYSVKRRSGESQSITVEVVLTKREVIETLLKNAKSAGIRIKSIVACGSSGNEAFLWRERVGPSVIIRGHLKNWRRRVPVMLLLLFIVFLHIIRVSSIDAGLTHDVSMIQKRSAGISAASHQMRIEHARVDFLAVRESTLPVTQVLADLTQLLPLDVSLSRFVYQNGVITCSGRARHAAELIDLVEKSSRFKDPHFVSATTAAGDGKGDLFDLSFAVRPLQ